MKKFSNEQELAYLALVNKVAAINEDAAVYMLTTMREIESFEPCGDLDAIVYWDQTAQGVAYWDDIDEKIKEEKQKEIDKEKQELDYQELIAKVAKIDKLAADYMNTAMREIKNFYACGDIWSVVCWEDTLQGGTFWHNISRKLENKEQGKEYND